MDFKNRQVIEAHAEFLRERMQSLPITVAELAHRSGFSDKQIHNYLNPDKAPSEISTNFYKTMQSALQFKHEDFREYYEEKNVDQSNSIIGKLNISGGSFEKVVFGAKDVHFHDSKGESGD